MTKEKLEEENKKLRRLVKELNSQKQQLLSSNKSKDVFFANMSHELKTPLNSILVISSVMAKNKQNKLDKEQIKNLEIIKESGNDLLYLINDVLDISKLEAGEMILELEDVDILQTLIGLKDMFEPLIQSKNLEFVCEFDEDIKMIHTDKHKVRQIIKNLLSNALKFVAHGKVRLRLEHTPDQVLFTVKDDGIGIPEEKLEHIFDRFKQAEESTTKKFGGSGLGLAICKELANLLGGDIVVHSQINKGSTFVLSLPLYLKKEHVKSQSEQLLIRDSILVKTLTQKPHYVQSNIKDILVVTQDHLNLFTSFVKLKKIGLNITQFDLPEYASKELRNEPFDLLLINLTNLKEETSPLILQAKELKMKIVIITQEVETLLDVDLVIHNEQIEDLLIPELLKL